MDEQSGESKEEQVMGKEHNNERMHNISSYFTCL